MILLENGLAYQFLFCITLGKALFPGSSAVEQATVNRLAGGSNPSRGAIPLITSDCHRAFGVGIFAYHFS